LGASLKSNMTTGGDGLAYTAGAITASLIDAGGQGSMVALTQIANSSVYGAEGAFAMAGSDMTLVNVISANGPASAISAGSIASATLNASTDASLVAIGNVSTSGITAAEAVMALTQGDLTGTTVDAGTDVAVASYGTLQLDNVNAGGNVSLGSVGDLTANVQAGGTFGAFTFGNLDGDFLAEDDIIELVARGNITGSYVSHDNVDAVFSYEGINADITAGGLSNPSDDDGDGCGHIRQVRAWNDVEGTLTADEEVEEVSAGGLAVPVITSPTTGPVAQTDRTHFTGWPEPRPGRMGDLTGEFADMQNETRSLSETVGIGGSGLLRAWEAAKKEMAADWNAYQLRLLEAHLRSGVQASKDGTMVIQMALNANSDAMVAVQITAADIDWVLRRVAQSEGMAQRILEAERGKTGNEADATRQIVSNDADQADQGANDADSTANRLKTQMDGVLQAWAQDVDVVANELSRRVENPAGDASGWSDLEAIDRLTADIERAYLAQGAYKGADLNLEDWTKLSVYYHDESGFRAVLFGNMKTGKVILSFAGTNPTDFAGDWKNNVVQGVGLEAKQYELAIALAAMFKDKLGDRLELVGHSLGGGLASAAALVSGIRATTFNPAGVHLATVVRHGTTRSAAKDLIVVYRVRGEALTTIENSKGPLGRLLPDSVGTTYSLFARVRDPVTLHGMGEVLYAMQQEILEELRPSLLESLDSFFNELMDWRNWERTLGP